MSIWNINYIDLPCFLGTKNVGNEGILRTRFVNNLVESKRIYIYTYMEK